MIASLFSLQASRRIERTLDDYFALAVQQAQAGGESYIRLWTNLQALSKAGGKRFRPNMTLLTYELFGGTESAAITPIAAAQELLHLSLLIHDDIIDREYTRYGVPNIAGRYKSFYQNYIPNSVDLVHFAHSTALLAGDLLLAGAHELIMTSQATDAQKLTAHQLLTRSIFDVAGGELLDTEASFLPYKPGDALKIALLKTARYSFVVPLVTGAQLAQASEAQIKALQEYAEALGVAYQLVDDLLGVFGTEQQTGKTVLGDIREGKRTFMIEQAMAAMNVYEKQLFSQAFGNPVATPAAISQVKEVLISCGAKAKTEAAIDEYRQKAERSIVGLHLPEAAQAKLQQLATVVTKRQV